jgi:hypothetical protein
MNLKILFIADKHLVSGRGLRTNSSLGQMYKPNLFADSFSLCLAYKILCQNNIVTIHVVNK